MSKNFVAINYITCSEEYKPRFEELFGSRAKAIDLMPGFVDMHVLKPNQNDDTYLVVSYWESEQNFKTPEEAIEWQNTHGSRTILVYKSDGKTVELIYTTPNLYGSPYARSSFYKINNKLYFVFMNGTNGSELWKTDGTTEGTGIVKDIVPGPGSSYINNICVVGNKMFFAAMTGAYGNELWVSDGTEQNQQDIPFNSFAHPAFLSDSRPVPAVGSTPH